MNWIGFATVLVWPFFSPPLQEENLLGDRKVQVKEAWFYKGPSRISGLLRKAEDGEEVTVVAVQGAFSKCTLKKDGSTGFLYTSDLVPPEKFKRSAADEKEGQRLAAQGLEGQRGLNPETEKEWRSKGGAARDQAYRDLDQLMVTPDYKADRPRLEMVLKDFRQAGKLGEFSPVQ